MTLNDKKLQGEWNLPDLSGQYMPAGLYLVATPIGNLGDITLRALHILSRADVVACEDTRVSGKLLSAYGIKAKLHKYNDHSDAGDRVKIVEMVAAGKRVALISDAGSPLISDPGYKLVREMREAGHYVTSVAGVSAVITGLQVSGMASESFTYLGFLPVKTQARKQELGVWKNSPAPLVVYETAKRIGKTLADISEVLGERECVIARELTKRHEEVLRGNASELVQKCEGMKGEIVLIVAPAEECEADENLLRDRLRVYLKTMKTKEAAEILSKETGVSKSKLYDMALGLK